MENLKQLQQFANNIISLSAPNVDFTKTAFTIHTDFGSVTYTHDNNILLKPLDSDKYYNLKDLNKESK